jgi:glutamine amidotransferase
VSATIAIVDSGGANIASLQFALSRLGVNATLTTEASVLRAAERVVLPGVGAAKDAMARLSEANLIDVIRGLQQPVLGICLGMQLLFDASEEEDVDCLGIFPGVAALLPASVTHPVPNMGWCTTELLLDHPVIRDISDQSFFYYLHSYALPVSSHTLATACHGAPFAAIVAKDNFAAVQFHPERSSAAGAQLISNFLKLPT